MDESFLKLVEKLNLKDLQDKVSELRKSNADLDFYVKFHAVLDDFEESIEQNRHKIKREEDKQKLAEVEDEIEEIRKGIMILENKERGQYLN